jgi:gamma-glutamyltranspeptidase / glutathione hydrolase
MTRLLAGLVVSIVLVVPAAAEEKPKAVVAKHGMVVCVSPEAADVGVEVLKQGGNAVDAAVAVAFAMAVTYPAAGNIGGGGFMLVYPPGKEPTVLEYRETAPAAVNKDSFAKTTDWHDHKAAGVPGTVRGLELAHKMYGKLPWKDLLQPAIRLANDGFVLDAPMVRSLNEAVRRKGGSAEFRRLFGKDEGKGTWAVGDRLVQNDLAKSLRRIAENGPDAFYTGELADLVAAEMKAGGGYITKDDLAGYKAKEWQPVHGTYRGYDVYGPPPPSSGGIALVEMLNMLEQFDLGKMGFGTAETRHLIAEVSRRAFVDRARYLGDPEFTRIPDFVASKEYAAKLARGIDLKKATPSESLAEGIALSKESENTTHFSVIDKDGMAVSNTYTLEDAYGSRVVVRGAGYILNNEMGDFNARPGVTNTKGQIGTEPNLVAPGKRMLSSQTPTVVAKNGKAILVTGSPGSRTIINTLLCLVTNVIDFEMDIQSAVDAPRQHHQWFPDELLLEAKNPELIKKLEALGHKVRTAKQGDAHSIWIDPKTGLFHGAADRRINGKAAGY